MKKFAVIVAGGQGSRMGTNMPKQFLNLEGKPILYYSIKAFLDAFEDMQIVLVVPEERIGLAEEIIDGYFERSRFVIVAGGRTRFHSVQIGLSHTEDDSIIFVHDAVRCLCTPKLIRHCYDGAMELGTAIPVVESNDSLRILIGENNEPLDRSKVKIVQTPQAFHSKILLPAFNGIDYKEQFTDEATVVEAFGMKVNLIEGETQNIKITRPTDILIAEAVMRNA